MNVQDSMARLGRIAAGLALLLALPAVAQEKMQLQLNWFQLADHSPIYLALKKGYYKEENIDLTVLRGSGSADSAKKIDLGQADVGISDAPTVLTAISKGANLKMVAVVFDKAGNNVFFKKSAAISTPKDMVGKKIAVPPADSHRVLWPAFATLNGIDAELGDAGQRQARGQAGDRRRRRGGRLVRPLHQLRDLGEGARQGRGRQPALGRLRPADLRPHLLRQQRDDRQEPEADRALPARHAQGLERRQGEPEGGDRRDGGAWCPGSTATTLLATMPQILDLCVTDRSARDGLGWIQADLMQKTMDITFASNKPEKPLALADVYTNQFSSKIKP